MEQAGLIACICIYLFIGSLAWRFGGNRPFLFSILSVSIIGLAFCHSLSVPVNIC